MPQLYKSVRYAVYNSIQFQKKMWKISHYGPRSLKYIELKVIFKCSKIQNACAEPLFRSLKLLFDDTLVAVTESWFAKAP